MYIRFILLNIIAVTAAHAPRGHGVNVNLSIVFFINKDRAKIGSNNILFKLYVHKILQMFDRFGSYVTFIIGNKISKQTKMHE